MKHFSLHYLLRTSRFEQIWFPLAFWVLFVILGIMRGEMYIVDTARAYLGGAVPLMGGIFAAYAILEDPALELRFTTPISALQTMLERLLPVFLIQTFFVLAFQAVALVFHADFSPIYGNWGNLQLAWLVPTLSLMALGSFMALAAAQSTAGALLSGMIWLIQIVARSWFADQTVARYFLVFMSTFMPGHPAIQGNLIVLCAMIVVFFSVSWVLLHRQERYI